MSGIYGTAYRSADQAAIKDAMGGLEYWNRIYGDAEREIRYCGSAAFGCHVEHFSDKFPYGGPILELDGCPAVVDALLYNRDELLPLLENEIDPCISDEELLLKLIARKGFRILRRVNGDFAGAVYNPDKMEWTLFRDHLGVRPLYYYMDDEKIVFSTDLRGVVSVPRVDCAINEHQIFERAIGGSYHSTTETEYQHIRCVRPGSVAHLRLTDDRCIFREKVYWKVREHRIRMRSEAAYQEKMRELVTDAVRRRCDAIPGLLGAELSGGLDSCVIDILINRYGRDALYFSWCTSPERRPLVDGEDERRVILDVCEQENITCEFKDPSDTLYTVDMLAAHMPPFLNTPSLYTTSRWIRANGGRVVFTGHGGDEGVSHRCTQLGLLYNLHLFAYLKIHWMEMKGKKLRLLRTFKSAYLQARHDIRREFGRPTREDLTMPLLNREYNERMIRGYRFRPLPFVYAPYKYVRNGGTRSRLDNCAFYGANAGVRYLFPYVDHRVMDFAVSIPRTLYINHKTSRRIFRETFADLMPQSLRDVQYKDMASRRNIDRSAIINRNFHDNLDFIHKNLDRELWGDMIDFDGLLSFHEKQVLSFADANKYYTMVLRLRQFVSIQETLNSAPRWREFDGESK